MHVKLSGSDIKNGKKIYSGIFRDGGAGSRAKSRFRKRRRDLMKREDRLIVLTGVPYGPGQETTWAYAHAPTYQEPTVMYLTGINQSEVILLLDPGSKESDEILFVRKKDPKKEFWDGIRFGVGDPASVREVKRVTGIKDVQDIDDFDAIFSKRLAKRKKKQVGTFWLESVKTGRRRTIKTDHNWKFKKRIDGLLKKVNAPKECLTNIMESHFELRLPLDAYDIANTLKAQAITGNAFKETLRNFRKLDNECRVQGFLEGQMLMNSPYGLSFPGIIAAGHNATVLHYMKNDDPIVKGELVLLDFGVRWMTMHADISRTVPASGKFNPMQRTLYEVVLEAQLAVEKFARAGVTIAELNDKCWETLEKGLDEKFYALGGTSKMAYKGRPHGVSHLMGEQEHDGDPFRDYGVEPMKPGWMISNEPGLYGNFRWKHKGRVYDEEIGIRIEDNLLITKTGCANLSKGVPKRVSEIERLMARPRRK
jgi:Xaa-Pro aminopeptidase